MMPLKRDATLETLRNQPRWCRQTLHAPSLTRLPAPHPTHPRNPLPYPGHHPGPHNSPPPQSHSPPDRGILLVPSFRRKVTPLRTAATFSLVLSRLIHLLTKPILAVCRTLLFSEAIYMLALVEVFFTPLHSVVTLCILSSELESFNSLFLNELSRHPPLLSSFSHARGVSPLARVLCSTSFSLSRQSSSLSSSHDASPHSRVFSLSFFLSHSSSSLPLQSAAYASASTRSLCAPQRAHNAVSCCPVCSISSGQRPTSRAPAARRAPCIACPGNSADARPRNSSAFSHFLPRA